MSSTFPSVFPQDKRSSFFRFQTNSSGNAHEISQKKQTSNYNFDEMDYELTGINRSSKKKDNFESQTSRVGFMPILNEDSFQHSYGSIAQWRLPYSFSNLLPANPKRLTFQQGDINDCYLLAGIDSLLHHPAAAAIFEQIQVQEKTDGNGTVEKYCLIFPSGRSALFREDELGRAKCKRAPLAGPNPLQMLELAYSKMTRTERNQERRHPFPNDGRGYSPIIAGWGHTGDALQDMFGGKRVSLLEENIPRCNLQLRPTDSLCESPNGLRRLVSFLQTISQNSENVYILGALTPASGRGLESIYLTRMQNGRKIQQEFLRDHYYSIRSFDLPNGTITVANPHDTANKVYTLTLKEFCDAFREITGIKLKHPQYKEE